MSTQTVSRNGRSNAPEINAPQPQENRLEVVQKGNFTNFFNDEVNRRMLSTVMPDEITPKRFIRISQMASSKTPLLEKCTGLSILSCMMHLSSIGLEPDGIKAHLIPRWNKEISEYECTVQVDYKGIVDLAWRSGKVAGIRIECVYAEEVKQGLFKLKYEDEKTHFKHEPLLHGERGGIAGAYSWVKTSSGEILVHWLRIEELNEIKNKSAAPNSPAWKNSPVEMYEKVVFKQHSKTLPLSQEAQDVIGIDNRYAMDVNDMAATKPSVSVVAPPVGRTKVRHTPQEAPQAPIPEGEVVSDGDGDSESPKETLARDIINDAVSAGFKIRPDADFPEMPGDDFKNPDLVKAINKSGVAGEPITSIEELSEGEALTVCAKLRAGTIVPE